MKKIFYLVLFFISHAAFSQTMHRKLSNTTIDTCEGCSLTTPASHIGKVWANERIRSFTKRKFKALHNDNECKDITYSPQVFLNLLDSVISKKNPQKPNIKKYDGLRAYFAVDPACDKMTLVFVPTITSDTNNSVHDDDLTSCWTIKNDSVWKICADTARNWTLIFDTSRLPKFEKDGAKRTFNPQFLETRSLWYDTIYMSNSKGSGLICYLKYLMCHHEVDNVIVKFGGFPVFHNKAVFKYWYHLTLIFDFHRSPTSKLNRDFITFTFNLNPLGQPGGDSDTDTGDPCPPYPPHTQTCPGTTL